MAKGAKAAIPIMIGYVPIGLLSVSLHLSKDLQLGIFFFMSLFVYAGSAQFIAAAMMFSGSQAISIITTTFLVNLRHLFNECFSSTPYEEAFICYSIINFFWNN